MTGLIKFLIYFWTALAIVLVFLGVYFLLTGFYRDGLTFVTFAAICAVMIWMNKRRLRLYGNAQQRGERKGEKK